MSFPINNSACATTTSKSEQKQTPNTHLDVLVFAFHFDGEQTGLLTLDSRAFFMRIYFSFGVLSISFDFCLAMNTTVYIGPSQSIAGHCDELIALICGTLHMLRIRVRI